MNADECLRLELLLRLGPIGVVIPCENAAHAPPAKKKRQSIILAQSVGALPPRTFKTCNFRESLSSSPSFDDDSDLRDKLNELFPVTVKMHKAKIAPINFMATIECSNVVMVDNLLIRSTGQKFDKIS